MPARPVRARLEMTLEPLLTGQVGEIDMVLTPFATSFDPLLGIGDQPLSETVPTPSLTPTICFRPVRLAFSDANVSEL